MDSYLLLVVDMYMYSLQIATQHINLPQLALPYMILECVSDCAVIPYQSNRTVLTDNIIILKGCRKHHLYMCLLIMTLQMDVVVLV